MKIVNINGPINAGKTTVSKLLTQKLPKALFVEVDDLLSDEEEAQLGLSMPQGWAERVNRLEHILQTEIANERYQFVVFAYPLVKETYERIKALETDKTKFINVTLSPSLDVCLTNRGQRVLEDWEIKRIREMYEEKYHHPAFADLIIDNSKQTPEETTQVVLDFIV